MLFKKDKIPLFTPERAAEYSNIVNNIFAPVFPLISKRIILNSNIHSGICLDIGTGAGNLGIEMAKQADFSVYCLDISEHILKFAGENIVESRLGNRVKLIRADAAYIPLKNNSVDLAVSRGSLFAWDGEKALGEIYRVLKPGGKAYLGLGLASGELGRQIQEKMAVINEQNNFKRTPRKNYREKNRKKYTAILNKMNIARYEITTDESGFWIFFEK